MRPFEAAREATADIGLAVMATTFSLVVIFVPVSFMSSISGRFLYQFGLTAAVSVLVSLLVSFSLTPMMCARLLRTEDAAGGHAESGHATSRGGFYAWLDRSYAWSLGLAMRHRWVIVAISALTLAAAVPIYRQVKQEYIPSDVDESEFEVLVFGPEHMSLAAMDEAMQALSREARATKGVALTMASAGGSFLSKVNQGYMYVRTVPHEERTLSAGRIWSGIVHGKPLEGFRGNYSQRDVMMALRQRFRKFGPDLRTQVRNIAGFNIGGGTFDIDLALRGPDLDQLSEFGEILKVKARDIGGIVDIDTTLRLDKPELRVAIDRQRAADLRVDTQQIATALRLMVGGDDQVSRFHDPVVNDDYDVQIRLMEKFRGDLSTIQRLYVSRDTTSSNTATGAPAQVNLAPGGGLVRLDNVVKIEPAATASRIDRTDRQRETRLRAGIAPGYGQADR